MSPFLAPSRLGPKGEDMARGGVKMVSPRPLTFSIVGERVARPALDGLSRVADSCCWLGSECDTSSGLPKDPSWGERVADFLATLVCGNPSDFGDCEISP